MSTSAAPATIIDVAPEAKEYTFTEEERLFFQKGLDDINKLTMQLNSCTSLLCTQQRLQGRWQIKQDGSGLTQIAETAT